MRLHRRVRHALAAKRGRITRQWPGTAHGFIFLSIEDETGIANAIIDPDLYEANRNLVTYAKFLLIEGALQNVDKVIHIRAKHIEELDVTAAPMESRSHQRMVAGERLPHRGLSITAAAVHERQHRSHPWKASSCMHSARRHLEVGGGGNNEYLVQANGQTILIANKGQRWLAMGATVLAR